MDVRGNKNEGPTCFSLLTKRIGSFFLSHLLFLGFFYSVVVAL